ncbi:AMP-binding protein [Virgibacillus natechei]
MNENVYLEKISKLQSINWPKELPKKAKYPYGKLTMNQYLSKRAKEHPDKPCIIFYGYTLTYKDLDDYSDLFASFLIERGIKKGDRIALYLPNCPQYLIMFYGALKVGVIIVPVNPMYKSKELEYQLNDSGSMSINWTHKMLKFLKTSTALRLLASQVT